ncbi:unnamed protein product [Paramecium sonneborni]|uniref:Uncharacterized protein n=1 Tax=Paramecium sonneborni TaxID=65129 RepID=A0A8S1PCG4_9CILI|nr:unnamed protein product [Paramecium sonneborni]
MNIYLGSQNFNSIQLKNTNISGLSFFDCDLANSKFLNVEINSCNFNFADLSNVEWINVRCKEKPFLKAHIKKVIAIQFSPNGQLIASAGEENVIKLWNADSYQFILNLEGHAGQINTLQFTKDSLKLFSGSDDCTIRQWDLNQEINPKSTIKSEIVDQFQDEILKVQISKDTNKLYALDKKECFYILNLSILWFDDFVLTMQKSSFNLFCLNPKQTIVAIAYDNSEIELIDYETKSSKVIDTVKDQIYKMEFSEDGNYLAIATNSSTFILDINKNKMISEFQFADIELSTILFDLESNDIIFSANEFIFLRKIHQPKIECQEKKEKCFDIVISPNGKLAALLFEKKIIIKEVLSQNFERLIPFDLQPNQIKFSEDSNKLSYFLNEQETIKHFQIIDIKQLQIIYEISWNYNQWKSLVISQNFEKLKMKFHYLMEQLY